MGFWDALTGAVQSVGRFAADHWKEIAVVAATTVVFAGVLVLTGGTAALLAPTLLQLAAAGVVSGAAGQVLGDVLDGRTPTLAGVAKAALIGGVVTVATAGVGRFIPGLNRPLQNQLAQNAVVATAGGVGGVGAQMMSNAIDGRPLMEGTGEAAVRGAVTTALASEGIRLGAPRIVNAIQNRRGQQQPPRGREALPDPDARPVVQPPRLTRAQAQAQAEAAAVAKAQALRSPDGIPLKRPLLDEVPRGVSAKTDVLTGETHLGVSGGPLNGTMRRVLAERGFDLDAIVAARDVNRLRQAMRDPEVRKALDPRIADDILARPDSDFIMTGPARNGVPGDPFLALPWNCAEVQALNAAYARGARPENLVSHTVKARENNPLNAGTPFKCCPNCANLLRRQGVFNSSDAVIAEQAHATTLTSDTTAAELPPARQPASKGFTPILDEIGK